METHRPNNNSKFKSMIFFFFFLHPRHSQWVASGRKTSKETDDPMRAGYHQDSTQPRGSSEQGAKFRSTFHTVSLSDTLSEFETWKQMQHSRTLWNGHHTQPNYDTFLCHLHFEDLTGLRSRNGQQRSRSSWGKKHENKDWKNLFLGLMLPSEQSASSATISLALFTSQPSGETCSPPHNQSVRKSTTQLPLISRLSRTVASLYPCIYLL